ncbi:MAG: hypothetical protein ACRDYZ_15490 [Acidimicrobiales bacterium]
MDPPRHLVLEARVGRLGAMHIDFRLRAEAGGTRLEIVEWSMAGPMTGASVLGVVETVVALRNRSMGRRLQRLVARREEQRRMAGGDHG